MATAEEIAWAAGFFEGEGSITHTDRDLQVLLKNTDHEVVARFEAIVDRGVTYGPYTNPSRDGYRRQPFWMWVGMPAMRSSTSSLLGCRGGDSSRRLRMAS